ncbi:MAG TPA: hypothetical protein GX529_08150, partial [Firmicutes bacterium]|nr:hypothetical protein [Candidatus Fermentithermobacillaceae bacterium]
MKRNLHLMVCLAILVSLGLGGFAALGEKDIAMYQADGPVLPLPLPPVEDDPPNANGLPGYRLVADGPVLPLPLPPVEDDPPNANGLPP